MSSSAATPEIRIDVRDTTQRERQPLIFTTYDDLAPRASMLPVNDHDPKPLYDQLSAERANLGRKDYLESGPETWQVRISKKPA
jgi:uncharacterized protein (DUF2249 family)